MNSALASPQRPLAAARAIDLALAAVAGALAYALSCLIVWPGSVAIGFGADWQAMSERPFALVGQFPQRLLTPLLSWSCGCRGAPDFLLFVRGTTIAMLATIWLFARRHGASRLDATLIAAAVAVISPVQMYKLHWVGYCDATTYTLLFAMALAAKRAAWFWSLFFACLLNHELAAFLLPWAWFARREVGADRRADLCGAGLALAAYAAFYLWVRAAAPSQVYNADYFARNPLFPGGTFVVLVVAIVHWVVAFGPVLAVLGWFHHAPATRGERAHLWWFVLGIAGVFCIAWDWARHTNLLVFPLVLASVRFLAEGHRLAFVGCSGLGVGLMLLWSPWPSVSWPTQVFTNPDFLLATGVVVPNPNGVEIGFGTLQSALTKWLPAVWPTLWPILAILAAMWTAGFWLARGRKPTPGAAT